ncbi:MAG: glycosyltransferase involved in cell wall biosynthesis [Arenicella sp.]|jgi:glycosyltransferase involved in cell wall biosynthesis
MKILILTRHFYPIDRPSGVISLIREFVSALENLGHEVRVACTKSAGEMNTYIDDSGLHIYKFHKFWPQGLRQIEKEFSPDRVIIFSSVSKGILLLVWWLLSSLIAGSTKKTCFYQTTNLELLNNQKKLFRLFLKPFNWVFCANKSIVDEIGLDKDMGSLLLPGVDLKSIRKIAPPRGDNKNTTQPFSVCFMGHLSHIKGSDIVVDLAERLPEIHFNIIAGYSPGKKNIEFYQLLIKRIHSIKNITHFDYASNPIKLLSNNNVLILPYRSGATVLGVAQSAIESMALGIPVLSSDNDAVREILIDGHNGYHAQSTEDFEQLILSLATQDANYIRLCRNAAETAESTFDISQQARKLLNIEKHHVRL